MIFNDVSDLASRYGEKGLKKMVENEEWLIKETFFEHTVRAWGCQGEGSNVLWGLLSALPFLVRALE